MEHLEGIFVIAWHDGIEHRKHVGRDVSYDKDIVEFTIDRSGKLMVVPVKRVNYMEEV